MKKSFMMILDYELLLIFKQLYEVIVSSPVILKVHF